MNLEIKGSLRILTPKLGYILYDKTNDSYSEKVYLGIYANVDDYEEVRDNDLPLKLVDAIANTNLVNDEQDYLIVELATELAILNLSM